MEVKLTKHESSVFGNLTSIQNPNTGVRMFMSSEVGKMFGHTNMKQAVIRLLSGDESMVITQKKFPKFIKTLRENLLIQNKTNKVQLISESGLWKLALHSNLPNGKALLDWVSREVLPSISTTGKYSLDQKPMPSGIRELEDHTIIPIQKENSIKANKHNYNQGGTGAIIEHNVKSCIIHTSMTPKEWKEKGKEEKLPASKRTSAKEVIRELKPEAACAMSLYDSLTSKGYDPIKVAPLTSTTAMELFKKMIEIGIEPAELNK